MAVMSTWTRDERTFGEFVGGSVVIETGSESSNNHNNIVIIQQE